MIVRLVLLCIERRSNPIFFFEPIGNKNKEIVELIINKNKEIMTNKQLWKLAKGIESKLWKYRELCYSEESNSKFDGLHDDLYWQSVGYAETLLELREELETTESHVDGWADGWLKSLQGELDMIKQIEEYYKLTQGIVGANIDWVYG